MTRTKEAVRSAFLWDQLENELVRPWERLSLRDVVAQMTTMVVVGAKGFEPYEAVAELVKEAWRTHAGMELPCRPEAFRKAFALDMLRGRVFPLVFVGPGPVASSLVGLIVALEAENRTVEDYLIVLEGAWKHRATDVLIAELDRQAT